MKAVILAGGFGKRLAPFTDLVPKPLLPVKGKPILWHILKWLKREGLTDIILCTGYLSNQIKEYFGDGSELGLKIQYSVEHSELGTGGALKNAQPLVGKGTFLVLYGDLLVDMDLKKFLSYHRSKHALATLSVHPSEHPYDSDMLKCNRDMEIIKFLGKPKPGQQFENIANAGVYLFEADLFQYFSDGKSMLDKEVLPSALAKGAKIYAYSTNEKIIDIGTHERYGKHK